MLPQTDAFRRRGRPSIREPLEHRDVLQGIEVSVPALR